MAQYKPILIACPQYGRLVRGSYACDERGQYLLGPDGTFLLKLVHCGQNGGRCMSTLCALHRYNCGGNGTWFPGHILAARPRRRRTPRPARTPVQALPSGQSSPIAEPGDWDLATGGTDLLC